MTCPPVQGDLPLLARLQKETALARVRLWYLEQKQQTHQSGVRQVVGRDLHSKLV